MVINVLNPAVHKSTIPSETVKVDDNGQIQLKHGAVQTMNIGRSTNAGNAYIKGTDYTIDMLTGKITCMGTNLKPGVQAYVNYTYADPTKVTAADIVGAVNTAGDRTGMKLLQDTWNQFGFYAKILIAPVFCTQTRSPLSLSLRQKRWEPLPTLMRPSARLSSRFWQGAVRRGRLTSIPVPIARVCAIRTLKCTTARRTAKSWSRSSRAAGLRAKVDLEKGFWWSNSNQEIQGITGVERSLSAMIDDPQTEVNQLNENGITTIFNSYGSGLRLWGNRTAAWPTVTHMRNFENVRRTGDVINESIRYFSQQYMDMPINQALIDALTESVNTWGRKLIADGALLGFECWYDPARNEQTELAAGHLLLSYKFTPPPPLERLTFETEITSEYLVSLESNR